MKEKYVLQTLSSLGRKFAGYDTTRYLAVTTFQRKYKRSRYNQTSKSIIYRNRKAMISQQVDEINNDKLRVFSKLNKKHQQTGELTVILDKYKEQRRFGKHSTPPQVQKRSMKEHSKSFVKDILLSPTEHHRKSLTIAQMDMVNYCQHYPDVFTDQRGPSVVEKRRPARMNTMDVNIDATRQFESVVIVHSGST